MSTPESGVTNTSSAPAPVTCWSCRGLVTQGDKFCKHCGRRQMRGDTWYLQAGWILFLSFTVLGPFALPLVWRSPHLNRSQKWVVGGVITLYSVLVLYLLFVITKLIWDHYMDFSRQLDELHI